MVNPIIFQLERDYISIVPGFAGKLSTPFGHSHEMFIDLVNDDHNLLVKNNLNTENLLSLSQMLEADKRLDIKISKIFKDFRFCTPSEDIFANATTFVPDVDKVLSETFDFFLDQGLSIDLLEKKQIEKTAWRIEEKTGNASMVRCIAHSKSDYSVLFECIFGELTEKEVNILMASSDFGPGISTPIFMFWMSIHYNE